MTFRFPVVPLCLLCATEALAQPAPGLAVGSGATGAPLVSPTAEIPVGLVGLLQRTMAGTPVLAVSYHGDSTLRPTPVFRNGDSTLSRLQAIATSAEYGPLIPFAIGRTWVLAPESREALNPALPHLGLADAAPRGLAFDALLASLSPAQARALGTEQGLTADSLSASARNALEAALHPPLRVVGPANAGAAAKESHDLRPAALLDITAPLDLSRLRLRAHLVNKGIVIPKDENTSIIIGSRAALNTRPGTRLSEPEGTPNHYGDEASLPITVESSNTLKPSDLKTAAFTKPIGFAGIVTVDDLIQRLRTVTGLDLYASVTYRDLKVFLGSEAIPCSDVLDGLRLALTGTWRKVGHAYLLTWDREGLRAIQQRTFEQTRALREQMISFRDKSQSIGTWLALANDLPFDPDDPLSPTPEQRSHLIPTPDGKWANPNGIPFEDLTPEQKDAAREWLRMTRRTDDEDLAKGRLEVHAEVNLEIQIPGAGWVDVPHTWQYGNIAGGSLAFEAMKARTRTGRTVAPPASVRDQTPVALSSPMRGVLVPALPPSRVADLAQEMTRHGLNTLFYPLLSNGYATYPSKVFPLNPSLHGKDGWEAAVSTMAAKGIRVVGTVDTLAWQNEGQSAHYLTKHRDWLDVDALGRPRLDWLKRFPDRVAAAYRTGFVPSNTVWAGEPTVAERLRRLVAEAAQRPGIGGIAFAAWRPVEPRPYTRALQPPVLGYGLAARLQAIQRHSLDPVDQPASNDGGFEPFLPRPLGQRRVEEGWAAPRTDEDRKDASYQLAEDLLRRAKAARSDWVVALINDFESADYIRYWDGPKIPKTDLLISTRPKDDAANGILLPVWPPGAGDPWDDAAPSPFEPGFVLRAAVEPESSSERREGRCVRLPGGAGGDHRYAALDRRPERAHREPIDQSPQSRLVRLLDRVASWSIAMTPTSALAPTSRPGNSTMTHEFDAPLLRLEGKIAWTVLYAPFSVMEAYGTNGRLNVTATLDGHTFAATLLPSRNGHYLAFNQAMKAATGKVLGDTVHVVLVPDTTLRAVEIPEEIGAALDAQEGARSAFDALPAFIRRGEISRILDARTEPTRHKRLSALLEKLRQGTGA